MSYVTFALNSAFLVSEIQPFFPLSFVPSMLIGSEAIHASGIILPFTALPSVLDLLEIALSPSKAAFSSQPLPPMTGFLIISMYWRFPVCFLVYKENSQN